MRRAAALAVQHSIRLSIPLIIDADGLFLISQSPELINAAPPALVVLTPNAAEFKRLWAAANACCKVSETPPDDSAAAVQQLSAA